MRPEIVAKILQENQSGYNQIAEKFSQTRKFPWHEFELFKNYLQPGDKVLDAGCGSGRLYEYLKSQDIDYTGLDNGRELIKIAKQQYPDGNFLPGDIARLPFPDNHFQAIFCIATFHHLPGKDLRHQVLREFNRVLRPSGWLLMTNWNLLNINWWPVLVKSSWEKITGRSDLDWRDIQKPWKNNSGEIITRRFLHAFTKYELSKLLKKNGFQVIKQLYSKRQQQVSVAGGYNLVTIAEKK